MNKLLLVALFISPAVGWCQTPGVLGNTPEIVHPTPSAARSGPDFNSSKKLANDLIPSSITKKVGSLSNGLIAYFSMDDKNAGGLSWSLKPIGVQASDQVQEREEGGRKFLDFSQGGAVVTFNPAFELPRHYTLAAWVQSPAPKNHGAIWHGAGMLLDLGEKDISYWLNGRGAEYAEFAEPLVGWYHVAVEFDGQKTQAFLNGKPLDSVKGNVSKNLFSVGNHPDGQHQGWMMAAGIDEMYFFNKNLQAEELVSLAKLGKP